MNYVVVLSATNSAQAAKMLLDIAKTPKPDSVAIIAEVRLDFFSSIDLAFLERSPVEVIATCRRPRDGGRFRGTESERMSLLRAARERGAMYVDIENDCRKQLTGVESTNFVVSHHDFEVLPVDLEGLLTSMKDRAVRMYKVAARLRTLTDIVAVAMSLKRHKENFTFVGTGPTGLVTRVLARRLGSEWTYAAWEDPAVPIDPALVAAGVPSFTELTTLHQPGVGATIEAAFAVVGSAAHESIGPWAWNRFFRKAKIPASYVALTAPSLVGLREAAAVLGIRGVSVTTPFKLAALDTADEITPRVKLIGSANTLVNEHGKWTAHNTDVEGFMIPLRDALKAAGREARDVRALVVGAGGTGRAAIFACKSLGVNVTLLARDGWKAAPVAEAFSVPLVTPRAVPNKAFDLVINATPAGSSRDPAGSAVNLAWLLPASIVFETNYRPRDTQLVKDATIAGHTVIRGETMYASQGLAQAQLFWGGLPKNAHQEFVEAVQWAMARRT